MAPEEKCGRCGLIEGSIEARGIKCLDNLRHDFDLSVAEIKLIKEFRKELKDDIQYSTAVFGRSEKEDTFCNTKEKLLCAQYFFEDQILKAYHSGRLAELKIIAEVIRPKTVKNGDSLFDPHFGNYEFKRGVIKAVNNLQEWIKKHRKKLINKKK